eukprot:TRINITY_DN29373_c0_g1_i1.p1 TRINITY_DN29373_c0_g1~~TRINITY_DN29373_c0_g1_i1.p1  ORF type:complete len:530 (+),score=98.88 TRINITY_DN29373_c0_g1_i1:71-1660(+)
MSTSTELRKYFDCATKKVFEATYRKEDTVLLEYVCDTYIDCDNWSDEYLRSGYPECHTTIVGAYLAYSILYFVLGMLVLACGIFVYRFRNHRVMKKSSWKFLETILAGGFVGFLSIVFFVGKPTSFLCFGRAWSLGLAFVFGWGSLFAKTYRIHKIFNNMQLRQTMRVQDRDLAKIVGILLAIEVFIFAVWAIIDPWRSVSVKDPKKPWKTHEQCVANYKMIFLPILGAYKAGLMIWGCKLAWDTRSVQKEFNESKWIAASIFGWVAVMGIGIPLLFTDITAGDRLSAFIIRHSFLAIGITFVLCLLFIPKFVLIYKSKKGKIDQESAGPEQTIGNRPTRDHKPGGVPRSSRGDDSLTGVSGNFDDIFGGTGNSVLATHFRFAADDDGNDEAIGVGSSGEEMKTIEPSRMPHGEEASPDGVVVTVGKGDASSPLPLTSSTSTAPSTAPSTGAPRRGGPHRLPPHTETGPVASPVRPAHTVSQRRRSFLGDDRPLPPPPRPDGLPPSTPGGSRGPSTTSKPLPPPPRPKR